jgi:hypothetical protein
MTLRRFEVKLLSNQLSQILLSIFRKYLCIEIKNFMRNKLTLVLVTTALASTVNAQSWLHDTVITGTGYLNNVYYSLENGKVAEVPADNWHIGLSTDRFSESIISNSADKGVRLFEIANDTTKFGTNLVNAFLDTLDAHPMSFYNSNHTWFKGAFNYASADYGWANYDMSTHWLKGNVVFGLITGADTLQVFISQKQTTPSTSAPVYVIKTAKIDGSNTQTYTLNVNSSVGRNFTYLNILTGTIIEREPMSANWDFLFSNYNDESVINANVQYKVFGIINNEKLKVARVDTPESYFDGLDYNNLPYDTFNNSLGRYWKKTGTTGVNHDSLTYFIKLNNGDIWQLNFTKFISALETVDPGLVAFRKRKVYASPIDTSSSIKGLEQNIKMFTIAPNPANELTHIIIDASENLGLVAINITNVNGQSVKSFTSTVNAGLKQIPLDISTLASGVYFIQLNGHAVKATSKLLKQ